ncbi:lytic transglycosylase [Gluconobacter thailandicus F149-1 = NBRC 100600]|uniref:Murein transglycosylase n=1 Tax=Gluconobacter thailandicus NBRC 3257 TaxID=1381097 RepID=A0ABQ0J0V8_GLUTH|nr:lytic transglycosylase domain-containing protein [Gluconobacter thailandicus]KXV54116.1 lytic transglycosylase [Gluconobacter thailandicus]GAC88756.1 murein transglycosylase [Gluconobacter thailandicus NBRC 3255]GAD28086.1 murein transglycosylase [Gluconobacter thailandicus NBRC 3257]GAN94626.1 lytic transglycosylase [Gluconobacter thailandicus F149-1 = NBRC 100600]GBR61334.1 murein transglycosylase [Gluconobacter thailandicus F149-1 = NBRC 100600]
MRNQIRNACLLAAGCLVSMVPVAVSAQTIDVPYAAQIAEAAQRFDIPATWIRAVMGAESAGDPGVVSSAGAMGLMQIMPGTWAELRVRHHLGRDPYDPRDNILAGAAYLRELHDRYGSPGFLAAYNAGPERYEASLAGRPLPLETRAYVAAVGPIIAGGGDDSVMIAAADRFAWTRTPLFIVQPDRSTAVASVRDMSGIMPRSDGLFMMRGGVGSRP